MLLVKCTYIVTLIYFIVEFYVDGFTIHNVNCAFSRVTGKFYKSNVNWVLHYNIYIRTIYYQSD